MSVSEQRPGTERSRCRPRRSGSPSLLYCFRTVLIACALVVTTGARPAWAGIYYEQEVRVSPAAGQPARITKHVGYISGTNARSESRSEESLNVLLTYLDAGLLRLLVADRKVYVDMPLPGTDTDREAPFQVSVTKTDQTKTIGGYRCTRFDAVTDGRTIRCWMATDVQLGEEVATYWQAGTRLYPPAVTRELAKLPGFPICIEVSAPQVVYAVTVTRLKRQEVPASLFKVPADYQPAFTIRRPPEQPPAEPPKE